MGLIDFTIDLATREPQPILAYEANKNAFLVLGEFIMNKDDKKKLEEVYLQTYNLLVGEKYVFIHCAEYIERTDSAEPGILIVFDISDKPVVQKKNLIIEKAKQDKFKKGDKIRIHISFDPKNDCKSGLIDNGNWPCNRNKIA